MLKGHCSKAALAWAYLVTTTSRITPLTRQQGLHIGLLTQSTIGPFSNNGDLPTKAPAQLQT